MPFCANDLQPQVEAARLKGCIQGNILRGFRRLKAIHVFFRFGIAATPARAWLKQQVGEDDAAFAPTSAAQQEEIDGEGRDIGGPLLINFFLTAEGLRFLGQHQATLKLDTAFQRGSRHEQSVRLLNDPTVDRWVEAFRRPWHGMILLSANDIERLQAAVATLKTSADGLGTGAVEWHVETGEAIGSNRQVLTENDGHRHEPFGYRDGIGQPVFTDEHWNELRETYADSVPLQRDPRRQLSCVLTPDPLAPEPAFGSYFVYRKLLQDVPGFDERVATYVATLKRKGQFLHALWNSKGGINPYDIFATVPSDAVIASFVKSRLLGRTTDGKPWPEWGNQGAPPTRGLDDFDYEDDRGAARCPFFAHARKMNPRGCTGNLEAERRRSVARRSIPFGPPDSDSASYKGNCGLLFMCAQGSIERQFERIQQEWANAAVVDAAASPTPTLDGLIGQRSRTGGTAQYAEDRHKKISETIDVDFDFYDLVRFLGGEYLFAPSIDGLRHLCA